jgi:hypothetical protein
MYETHERERKRESERQITNELIRMCRPLCHILRHGPDPHQLRAIVAVQSQQGIDLLAQVLRQRRSGAIYKPLDALRAVLLRAGILHIVSESVQGGQEGFVLLHVALHDAGLLGEVLEGGEQCVLLRVVVVLDGLDPGGTEEEEVADILGGMDVGCLAVDEVEAADENGVGVRHLRGAVDG